MGYRTGLLALLIIITAGCGKNTADNNPAAPSQPHNSAEYFSWTRSIRGPDRLKPQWKLKARKADEIIAADPSSNIIQLLQPHITYFQNNTNKPGQVLMQAPEGIFREKDNIIEFTPGCLLSGFQSRGHAPLSFVADNVVYSADEGIIRSTGTFRLSSEDIRLTSENLEFALESGVLSLHGPCIITINKTPALQHMPSPAECKRFTDFHNKLGLLMRNANTQQLVNFGHSTVDLSGGLISLSGPITISTQNYTMKCNQVQLTQRDQSGRPLNVSHPFSTITAQGAVHFSETGGQKRTVTCTSMQHDLVNGTILMQGNPVLTSETMEVTAHRITYLAAYARFLFAKPFTIRKVSPVQSTAND